VLDPAGLGIARAAEGQYGPAVGLGFDGANYLVVWEDYRIAQPDIYGSVVTPAGVVIDSGAVVRQEGNQLHPALARGAGSELFLVYQGWVGIRGGKNYSTYRTWGKFNPEPSSVEETPSEVVLTPNRGATIVRRVLFLSEDTSFKPQAASLLDVSGRKVIDLKAGANDVSGLAPGVYFVREEPQSAGLQPQAVRKVVLTR
jgi:hypothetical protein